MNKLEEIESTFYYRHENGTNLTCETCVLMREIHELRYKLKKATEKENVD